MYSIYMYNYAIIFVRHSEFPAPNINALCVNLDLVLDPSIGPPKLGVSTLRGMRIVSRNGNPQNPSF